MIEARCPHCRNLKDPDEALCVECTQARDARSGLSPEMKAFISRQPVWILWVVWVCMGTVQGIWKYKKSLACTGVAGWYLWHGNLDLLGVWLMLGVLALPVRQLPPNIFFVQDKKENRETQ